jgi:drug/metabolite transporter (DMT)-like permease
VRGIANVLLLAVALVWGSAFVAQAKGMEGLGPWTFTGLRFLLGGFIVLPLAWRDYRGFRTRDVKPGAREYWGLLLIGLLLSLGAVFQQIGLVSTTVTNAGFLTGLYVPLVPLISWLLLRMRPHWSVWPCSVGCLVGMWLLSGANSLSIGVGDSWVIASSLFWALHVIFIGRIAGRIAAPYLVACVQFFVCGALCTVVATLTEAITLSGIVQAAVPILYTGIFSIAFAYTGQVVGQRYTEAADAAIILSAETIFAALFGFLLMGERLSTAGLAGCALIFTCIVAVQMLPLRPARAAASV